MISFSEYYNCKFELLSASEYKFTECGKCFNSKTGRNIKMILKGYTKGFIIRGKFQSLKKLRGELIKIQKTDTPF